jgi:hypothetical protein
MHRRRIDDGIRLKGSSEAQIVAQIRNSKHGVMPGWNERPREPTFKHMAVYVRTLGGGRQAEPLALNKEQAMNAPNANPVGFVWDCVCCKNDGFCDSSLNGRNADKASNRASNHFTHWIEPHQVHRSAQSN